MLNEERDMDETASIGQTLVRPLVALATTLTLSPRERNVLSRMTSAEQSPVRQVLSLFLSRWSLLFFPTASSPCQPTHSSEIEHDNIRTRVTFLCTRNVNVEWERERDRKHSCSKSVLIMFWFFSACVHHLLECVVIVWSTQQTWCVYVYETNQHQWPRECLDLLFELDQH